MSIRFEDFTSVPEATEQDKFNIQNLLDVQTPAFTSAPETFACLAFGGTIQSAYVPSKENITPVKMNPALERLNELNSYFSINNTDITGAILVAKDSRNVTISDVILLIHTIRAVRNRKILISCGTYMLPTIARILDYHFSAEASDKTIGLTGSMLPLSLEGQDADLNIGGAVAAIHAFALAKKDGTVFAQFHGNIYMGSDLEKLDLHQLGDALRFARSYVDAR